MGGLAARMEQNVRSSPALCDLTAEAARGIFGLQRVNGWGFDAEILFLARRLGFRLKEVPVRWTNDATTNVRLTRDSIASLLELVSVRVGAWRGRYPTGEKTQRSINGN